MPRSSVSNSFSVLVLAIAMFCLRGASAGEPECGDGADCAEQGSKCESSGDLLKAEGFFEESCALKMLWAATKWEACTGAMPGSGGMWPGCFRIWNRGAGFRMLRPVCLSAIFTSQMKIIRIFLRQRPLMTKPAVSVPAWGA